MPMTGAAIRAAFLSYFERHGHKVLPGSSLVPGNDPSLLFTNAGMVQFKEYFLGLASAAWKRARPPPRGPRGPGGPCSEIIYDQGEATGCGRPSCAVGCDCDRFLEIWNLVFMQFNQDGSGARTPLPKPSIDTGMGLERLAAVVQGVKSNYDSDLFRGIIAEIGRGRGGASGRPPLQAAATRVIADHARATAFLIADGILPANEGRGYVLRRIMRRALRHGNKPRPGRA